MKPTNEEIADVLARIADLLEAQDLLRLGKPGRPGDWAVRHTRARAYRAAGRLDLEAGHLHRVRRAAGHGPGR